MVEEKRIRVFPTNRDSVTPYLLGRVLGLWFEMQGLPILHGACLLMRQGSVGILGQSGMGKSTLAAATLRAGHQLLSDDLIPLEKTGDCWQVAPGLLQMRLWPDSGEHFFADFDAFQKVHPDYPKRKLVPARNIGLQMAETPGVLQALIVLARSDDDDICKPQWDRLMAAEAMVQLIGHSYNVEALEALGWQSHRLAKLAKVAESVPVWQMTYPTGFTALGKVVEDFELRWG